ncbi:VanW family protein [Gorillibacterium sp. sgz5001074]|uniref:VanW family protein n=1 Tax=Gorillibacterium sp. sgz5001074 TaxID=3446695 RepID=UPI003F6724B5
MRQKRKGGPWKTTAIGLGVVVCCGLAVLGLGKAGIVNLPEEAYPDHWWQQKSTAAAPTAAPKAEAAAGQQSASPSTPAQAPSAKPAATPQAASAAAGKTQILGQAQSAAAPGGTFEFWNQAVQEVKIAAGQRFSMNEWVKQIVKDKKVDLVEQDLSQLASLMYEAAIRSGMEAGERYLHKELPAYANPGFDVAYEPDRKDLTLLNPFENEVQAGITFNGSLPILHWSGTPVKGWAAPGLDVTKETFAPERILMVDYQLTGGGEVKRKDGKDGQLVKVYKLGKDKEPKTLLYKDYYATQPVEYSRPPTPEELKAAAGTK